VHAVGLNPVDYKTISGSLSAFFAGPSVDAPLTPGKDVAGVVTATSSASPAFPVGTRVFGCLKGGALAEQVAAPESLLAAIPDGVSFVDAAATPLAALTVLQCLRRLADEVGEGPTKTLPSLLVSSGAGGTGSFALQLAKRVFEVPRLVTTVSAAKADVATSLGADETVDYKTTTVGHALAGDRRVVAAVDLVGDIPGLLPGIVRGGAVVGIAGPFQPSQMGSWAPAGLPIHMRLGMWAMCAPVNIRAALAGVHWSALLLESNGRELAEVATWMSEGKVKPLIDSVHEGLGAAAAAFEKLMGGHAVGKIVVRVVPEGE